MASQRSEPTTPRKPPVPKNKPKLVASFSLSEDPTYAEIGDALKSPSKHHNVEDGRAIEATRRVKSWDGHEQENSGRRSTRKTPNSPEVIYARVNKRKCNETKHFKDATSNQTAGLTFTPGIDSGTDQHAQGVGVEGDRSPSSPMELQLSEQSPSIVLAQVAFFESLDDTGPSLKPQCISPKAKKPLLNPNGWNNTQTENSNVSCITSSGISENERAPTVTEGNSKDFEKDIDKIHTESSVNDHCNLKNFAMGTKHQANSSSKALISDESLGGDTCHHQPVGNQVPNKDDTVVLDDVACTKPVSNVDSTDHRLEACATDSSSPNISTAGAMNFPVDKLNKEGTDVDNKYFDDDLEPYAVSQRKPYKITQHEDASTDTFTVDVAANVDNIKYVSDTDAQGNDVATYDTVDGIYPGSKLDKQDLEVKEKDDDEEDDFSPYAVSRKKQYMPTQHESDDKPSIPDESKFFDDDEEPYAISRKRGALYSTENENPYEDVDSQEKWSHSTLVDKHIYDYICAYEELESEWRVDTDIADECRDVVISVGSERDFESFKKLYDRIRRELWVEGIKSSSVTDINSLLDQLQSKYRCIWSRPNDEDVEIVCRREDIDEIKRTIEQHAGSVVHFLYERAKSLEVPEELEPTITFIAFEPSGYSVNGNHVYIHIADITDLKVSAIVNAANGYLNHGSGVAKAIARAAGHKWENSCKEYVNTHGMIPVSEVVKTGAGDLPCDAVLHAVGPRWPKRDEKREKCKQDVHATVRKIMRAVEAHKMKSVAIPPVCSGAFKVPHEIVSGAIVTALVRTPRLDSCQGIHIVDIREEVLSVIKKDFEVEIQRVGASNPVMIQSLHKADVEAAIKAVKGDNPMRRQIGNKIKVLFTKAP